MKKELLKLMDDYIQEIAGDFCPPKILTATRIQGRATILSMIEDIENRNGCSIEKIEFGDSYMRNAKADIKNWITKKILE